MLLGSLAVRSLNSSKISGKGTYVPDDYTEPRLFRLDRDALDRFERSGRADRFEAAATGGGATW